MKNLPRSTALKIAAVLSFLISGFSLIYSLPLMFQGASGADQNQIPFVVLLIGLITGTVGVVAAFGAWKQLRWGIVLTILANLVNGLSAAPGILFAPNPGFATAAIVTVVLSVLIIVLCLWHDRQPITV